jgi:hypothetical protein
MVRILVPVAGVSAALGFLTLLFAWGAARRRRWFPAAFRSLAGLLLVTVSALLGTVSLSIHGYRVLTREEVAATVRTVPTGAQRFRATVSWPDGREETFEIRGDALYVDAHILKWQPWLNLLGLHTAYELDRMAGRYEKLEDERGGLRTIYPLGRPKLVDLFHLVRKFPRLALLVDAEYGSATFVAAHGGAAYEILVSTSGLLARPMGGSPIPAVRQ